MSRISPRVCGRHRYLIRGSGGNYDVEELGRGHLRKELESHRSELLTGSPQFPGIRVLEGVQAVGYLIINGGEERLSCAAGVIIYLAMRRVR